MVISKKSTSVIRDVLIPRLSDLGYHELQVSNGGHCWAHTELNIEKIAVTEDVRCVFDFFARCQAVKIETLTRIVGSEVIDALYDVLPFERNGDLIRYKTFSLLTKFGLWFFAQNAVSPSVYFGDDSEALMLRVPYLNSTVGGLRGRSVLDVCSGSGIQGLMARILGGATVDFVEVNEEAANTLRLNVEINCAGENCMVHNVNAIDFLRDQTREWDYLIFNPPLLPAPLDGTFPFVGAGGDDGLVVSRLIINQAIASRRIRHGVHFVGAFMGDTRKSSRENAQQIIELFPDSWKVRVVLMSKHQSSESSNTFRDMYATAVNHCLVKNLPITPSSSENLYQRMLSIYGDPNRYLGFFSSCAMPSQSGESAVIDISELGVKRSVWFY